MQVDTDTSVRHRAETDVHRSGRGGDRGGRRPIIGDVRLSAINVMTDSRHVAWMSETTGGGGKGRGKLSEFIRTLMAAAVGMGLSLADWKTIARSPARFRDAIKSELKREPESPE